MSTRGISRLTENSCYVHRPGPKTQTSLLLTECSEQILLRDSSLIQLPPSPALDFVVLRDNIFFLGSSCEWSLPVDII